MRRPGRGPHEAGTALVEFTWLAILLMVPLLYVVLAVFEVQRSAFGVTTAARAAGRAYTQAPSEAQALGRAVAAADVALADQGMKPGAHRVAVTCVPDLRNCLAPGSVVSVEVSAAVPLPLLPEVLGGHRPSVDVRASHSLPYGAYREDRP